MFNPNAGCQYNRILKKAFYQDIPDLLERKDVDGIKCHFIYTDRLSNFYYQLLFKFKKEMSQKSDLSTLHQVKN